MAPAHMTHGSNVTYSSASSRRQLLRCSAANLIAVISAWPRGDWRSSRSLYAVAMTCPANTMTAPTGISPRLAAFRAADSAISIYSESLVIMYRSVSLQAVGQLAIEYSQG